MGKYHCTVDLLFDWFGICCVTTVNFCVFLQNRLIQTLKQEVNGTVILPSLVFPVMLYYTYVCVYLFVNVCMYYEMHIYVSKKFKQVYRVYFLLIFFIGLFNMWRPVL